ncbi:hypothetical protein Aspvir_009436 [Aspergillus viridinutans]|uniref:Uncharacterized protein n=1 Tax=Aspergillus viridinutans TaxID=75553 RepID=A0A9P3C004_ASPVI|nr:uncharacterized protein Aspvir_009436 [Aspergillus viridinutans]GIK05329.1 hypothetical protein Aspvir_009436 [Aspergillus viridinutans]
MWAIADPSSSIRRIQIKTRSGEAILGQLKAPTVIVNVTDFNSMLYFQWNFSSGTMNLYTTEDPNNPDMKTFDLSGWTVAFRTSLSREAIPPSDPSYPGYVAKMDLPSSSIFSIAKLYIKSQESPGYYPEGSNFQGIDWSKESDATQNHFQQLRVVWMDAMSRGGLTNIAVMLQTEKPQTVNPLAPTFPPTSIDYSVYPWKDPVYPLPPSNNSNSNALCYLIMTSKETPPVPPQIAYTGTWVNTDPSEPGRGAILCMSDALFWESWLLPLLQVINRATQIQPYNPHLIPWEGHPGVTQSASASTSVTFTSGGQAFSITGKNAVSINCTSFGQWYSKSDMSFTMQYKLNFAVTRVDDGGLQILCTSSRVSKGPVSYHTENINWTPAWDVIGHMCQDSAGGSFERSLEVYRDNLLNDLAGVNKLILPGAGDYLCSNVMFTKPGALVTNLAYNGAAAPGEKIRIPDILKDAPPRQRGLAGATYSPPERVSLVSKSIPIVQDGHPDSI